MSFVSSTLIVWSVLKSQQEKIHQKYRNISSKLFRCINCGNFWWNLLIDKFIIGIIKLIHISYIQRFSTSKIFCCPADLSHVYSNESKIQLVFLRHFSIFNPFHQFYEVKTHKSSLWSYSCDLIRSILLNFWKLLAIIILCRIPGVRYRRTNRKAFRIQRRFICFLLAPWLKVSYYWICRTSGVCYCSIVVHNVRSPYIYHHYYLSY